LGADTKQASHFAALSTLEVVGKSTTGTLSGVIADGWGYTVVYQLALALSVGCMLLLPPLYDARRPKR
jgi:sugar phosphate permease